MFTCYKCGHDVKHPQKFTEIVNGKQVIRLYCDACADIVNKPRTLQEVLKAITDQALQDEIERRKKIDEETEAARLKKRQELILEHIDVLLEFVDVHDRTTCSDEHPEKNDIGRCSRCMLLKAKKDDYASDLYLSVCVMPLPENNP